MIELTLQVVSGILFVAFVLLGLYMSYILTDIERALLALRAKDKHVDKSIRLLNEQEDASRYGVEELIDICELAMVHVDDWHNPHTGMVMQKLGRCWALL